MLLEQTAKEEEEAKEKTIAVMAPMDVDVDAVVVSTTEVVELEAFTSISIWEIIECRLITPF